MTRRKKTALVAIVVTGLFAALLAWPRPNYAAREALATLRDAIDMVDAETVNPNELHQTEKVVVKLDMQLMTHCLDDATAGLFVQPGEPSRLACGRVGFANATDTVTDFFRDIRLDRTAGWGTKGIGCVVRLDHNIAKFSGFEVTADGFASDSSTLAHQSGWCVNLRPRLTRQGEVLLELEGERDKASAGKIAVWVRSGETLIIGGLKQPGRGTKTLRAPLLSKLPRVGSWFTWTYERDLEEELILLLRTHVEEAQ
jgi:hypothetical protein